MFTNPSLFGELSCCKIIQNDLKLNEQRCIYISLIFVDFDCSLLQAFSHRPSYSFLIEFFKLYYWGLDACENALNSTVIQNLIKNQEKFDVILMEQFNNDCMMGVAWKLKAPVIALSSCAIMPYHFERFGIPSNPSYIPSLFTGYSDQMSFSERLHNWFAVHLINFLYK